MSTPDPDLGPSSNDLRRALMYTEAVTGISREELTVAHLVAALATLGPVAPLDEALWILISRPAVRARYCHESDPPE